MGTRATSTGMYCAGRHVFPLSFLVESYLDLVPNFAPKALTVSRPGPLV